MKHGPWTIEEKEGRIFCRHRGRPPMICELLPENQVPAKAGQFNLENGLTLRIVKRFKGRGCWYCVNDVYDTFDAALKVYQAAGGRLPAPAFSEAQPKEH